MNRAKKVNPTINSVIVFEHVGSQRASLFSWRWRNLSCQV
jgi:hypothetical protein